MKLILRPEIEITADVPLLKGNTDEESLEFFTEEIELLINDVLHHGSMGLEKVEFKSWGSRLA